MDRLKRGIFMVTWMIIAVPLIFLFGCVFGGL